jgi:hypothetical protein
VLRGAAAKSRAGSLGVLRWGCSGRSPALKASWLATSASAPSGLRRLDASSSRGPRPGCLGSGQRRVGCRRSRPTRPQRSRPLRRSARAKVLPLARAVVGGYGTARRSPTPLSSDTSDTMASAPYASGRMGPQAPPAATTCRDLTLASGGTGAQALEEPGLHKSSVDCQARCTVARPIRRSSRAAASVISPSATTSSIRETPAASS